MTYGRGEYGSGIYGDPATPQGKPKPSRWGVVSVRGAARTRTRMRSGTIDAGVRSVAENQDRRHKPSPETLFILKHMVMIDRPSEQWVEEQPVLLGSLKKIHRPDFPTDTDTDYYGRGTYGSGVYG